MAIALWLIVFSSSAAAALLTITEITDQVESGQSYASRPSWRVWKVRRLPLRELRLHRQMFPSSRLRILYWLACSINVGCIFVPFVVGFIGSAD